MQLKEISKDIYDVDAWLDDSLGKPGTPERERNTEKAWEEYNAQILLDTRKNAGLTQSELAKRIGVEKGYISRIERGLLIKVIEEYKSEMHPNPEVVELEDDLTCPFCHPECSSG